MSALRGVIKFFDEDRGFGFITRDDGQGEVFVHITDLRAGDIHEVSEGDRVEFDLGDGRKGKGKKAIDIKLLPMGG